MAPITVSRLALTLPLLDLETPASYVARLARRNFLTPREFCSDVGLRWPSICSSHPDQIARLAQLAQVDIEQLSFTAASPDGRSTYRVGRSTATTGTFLRAITRVCPKCIVDRVERFGEQGPFQRLDWSVLCLGVCLDHHMPLVRLPNASHTHYTYDVVGQALKYIDVLRAAASSATYSRPTTFEDRIIKKLCGDEPADWLTQLDLSQLHRGSLSLGATLRGTRATSLKSKCDQDARLSMEQGYRVLAGGADGLLEALHALRASAGPRRGYYTRDLGDFHVWLKENASVPSLSPIRKVVRDFLVKNYSMKPSNRVLGHEVRAPHSITLENVRRMHGIGKVRVRAIMEKLNVVPECPPEKVQDISQADLNRVLDYWNGLLNVKSATEQLGVCTGQVKALINTGVLHAVTLGSSLEYVTSSSLQRLLVRVNALRPVQKTRGHLLIGDYCKFRQIPLAVVVKEWVDGKIEIVSRSNSVVGLSGLLLDEYECLEARGRIFLGDLSLVDAARYLRVSQTSLRRLRDAGYLEMIKRRNPATRHFKSFITEESLQRFDEKYVTLGCQAKKLGVAAMHLATELDRQEIKTIDCESGLVRVYDRTVMDSFS